jgi:hypothetical protein
MVCAVAVSALSYTVGHRPLYLASLAGVMLLACGFGVAAVAAIVGRERAEGRRLFTDEWRVRFNAVPRAVPRVTALRVYSIAFRGWWAESRRTGIPPGQFLDLHWPQIEADLR